jgi:hypothetical protein
MRIIIDIDGKEIRPVYNPPKSKKTKPSTEEDGLKLRLLNQDTLQEDEKAALEGEIVLHVRKMLKKKKKKEVFTLLKDIKDSMSTELRDLLSEEIKLM